MKTLLIEKENRITKVTLNRPDVHNAFNEDLTKELYETFSSLNDDKDTRLIVLTGAGKSFSAGADLNYMKSAAQKNREQNIEESLYMAKMLKTIDEVNKPVLGVINGTALGGGMGLVSVCDVVIAHEEAKFGFSEVKLGMAPSVISPFVVRKIGIPNARRYFLTGERFGGETAQEIGLVNAVYDEKSKSEIYKSFLKHFLTNAPEAMAHVKKLLRLNWQSSGEELTRFTAEQISDLRASKEAQEGIKAFFEKRPASYVVK